MFSTTKDTNPKQDFDGSAAKKKNLPDYDDKSVKSKTEFGGGKDGNSKKKNMKY